MKKAAMGARGGLNGYRTGAAKDGRPPVGFDKVRAAAELDMSAYGFSVPAESGAGYGALAARLDDLVSATSVSFDAYGYEGSTGGGTYGIATVEPAPRLVERAPWPRTIECAAAHELTHHELTRLSTRPGSRCGCFSFLGFCRVGFVIGYGEASAWW
ncbi:hypothetical protein CYMTET_21516 [Cymbomonas tetramitiformis]|uniref:Uncharacterized protein n=1 Tax=Cymbomonas tetramitiformis TaxID=36881 RepID=A0AAE0G214_9CHLO|nr:hypothetical protein CYMTET_21516 [Cymbomonas tetramitiformis]